jgi:hypothetical protein
VSKDLQTTVFQQSDCLSQQQSVLEYAAAQSDLSNTGFAGYHTTHVVYHPGYGIMELERYLISRDIPAQVFYHG